MNAQLVDLLGQRRAAPYLIAKTEPIPGTRYRRIGLELPSEAIEIREHGGETAIGGDR